MSTMRQTKAIMRVFRKRGKSFLYCKRRFKEVLNWDGEKEPSEKANRIIWSAYKKENGIL